ncbi:MAG TPA: NAD-dependent dehydratase [Armatimonadetes bacterium]|nr:SDR family oxidoreductase [Armatimonadota bacterium]MCA1998123.1 SDR family oxidoreductase [Armatimonadota bacterium]HCE00167.1 NAD-dependent dehydratase [Armatimonadota bacterium]
MRAVITGGAGFLGSHLVDRCLDEGWEVVVIDNLITGNMDNLAHRLGDPRFRFIKQDVSEFLYVDGPVDFVFHFASPASPIDFKRYPIQVLKVGALGTHKALGLAKAKGARFMLASTSEVYGDPAVTPQPETYWGNVNPIGPRGVYDEAKRYAEAMTMAYHHVHGLDTRIVRFFNTYGPRMRLDDGRVVPNFVAQALRGEPLTVYGDGSQTRSFGYVDDTIDGVWRLAHSDFHEPVNIGNDRESTILEFAEAVLRATGSASPIVHLPPAPDDPQRRRPDLTRARTILGWEPRTPLEEGLAKTVAYFRGLLT